MPQKRKSHGDSEKHGGTASLLELHHNRPSYPISGSHYSKSQSSRTPPVPAAPVSAAKLAQSEKESAMASKPGVVTRATGGATGSGTAAGGSAPTGTAGKGTAKAQPETNTALAGATVIDMSSAGSAAVDMATTGGRGPKAMSKTAPVSQAKATAPSPAAPAGVSATKPKDTAKSTAAAAVKAEAPKVDPAKESKPVAAAPAASAQGKKEEPKPSHTKASEDPFDALASILPSADPVAPQQPVYTGPEVTEHGIIAEKAPRCGEREDTLPPGYRFEGMAPVPADAKTKDSLKPMTRDQALDSLSSDFTTATDSKTKKEDRVESISASSAGPTNFAPPPVKNAQAPPAVSPAPPADKKAKREKVPDDFSLAALLPSAPSKEAAAAAHPPADKKAKLEKVSDFSLETKVDPKPKMATGASMSLDALSALCDTLPEDAPKPESPKLRPEDIVSEDKLKKEKGVRVGERDDTLPPDYRFDEEELKKHPAPKPEPSMSSGEALDMLAGDFMSSSAAPAVQAPAPAPAAPSAQKSGVPRPAVCPPAPSLAQTASDDFSLEGALSASTAKKVESSAATDKRDKKDKTGQGASMSLDALSALCDTLPEDAPKPESPKLRPEDIVSEDKLKKEKGVRVGERDDTLPPDYRFDEEELKKHPAPKPEPSMSSGEALDMLAGDFMSSSAAPAVQAPAPAPAAPVSKPPGKGATSSTAVSAHGPAHPAPAVKAPAPAPAAPVSTPPGKGATSSTAVSAHGPAHPAPAVKVGVQGEDVSALNALAADFAAPTKAPGVQASAPPPTQKTPKVTVCPLEQRNTVDVLNPSQSIPFDALSALSETLVDDTPRPESPKLKAEDMVSEDKLKKEKGVRVGERDDTLPPDYRFDEEELKKHPAPKPEPSMSSGEALDMLAGDFMSSSAAPAVQAPAPAPAAPVSKPPGKGATSSTAVSARGPAHPAPAVKAPAPAPAAPVSTPPGKGATSPTAVSAHGPAHPAPAVKKTPKPSADFALDALASDFVASAVAPAVKSTCVPMETTPQLDPLDALSDTLKDIKPVPQPAPAEPKDVVKEKMAVEEKLIKMGEGDDTLPPEYRPSEEDRKAMEVEKKKADVPKEAMDQKTALDLLASDFDTTPAAHQESLTLESEPQKPMAGPVLQSLSDTLLPDAINKPKKQQAEEPSAANLPSVKTSSDVVATSKTKGRKS